MPRVLTPGVLALVSGAALATNLVLVWATGTRIFLDGYLVRGVAVVAIAILLFVQTAPKEQPGDHRKPRDLVRPKSAHP